jgi:hypothetical protein
VTGAPPQPVGDGVAGMAGPWRDRIRCGNNGGVEPQVVRYSERPELWESISDLSDEVWPEYNQHGETLNYYWAQLYDVFPEWQFVLYDPADKTVLAEGHTIPWPGTVPTPASGRASTPLSPPPSTCARQAGSPRRPARWPPRSRRVTKAGTCPACC